MITLSTYLTFIGFWACYQSSQRAVLVTPNVLERYLRHNSKQANLIGISTLLAGLLFSVFAFGVGSGFFAFVLDISVVGSLVILLAPIGYVSLRSATWLFIVLLLFELLIYAS